MDYKDEYDHYYVNIDIYFTGLKPIYEKRKWGVNFIGEVITVTNENQIDKANFPASLNRIIYYTKESEKNERKYEFKVREEYEFKKYLDSKEIEYINYYFLNLEREQEKNN